MTDAERQKRMVERKKAQGLVLKRVWVPPEIWPAIRDLATSEAEAFAFSGGYVTTNDDDHLTAYTYELARGLWDEITTQSLAAKHQDPQTFRLMVLRAMIKTIPAPFTPTQDQIMAAQQAVFGEDDFDAD